MREYIWLFPILFILHEFEEIIGFGVWYQRNEERLKQKYPKVAKKMDGLFNGYSTEGMAAAVVEEFLLCLVVCVVSLFMEKYQLWIGIFIAFILHMIMHIGQALLVKGYVPSVVTSVIEIVPCTMLVRKCVAICNYGLRDIVVWSIVGVVIIGVNVKFAHYVLHKVTKWMDLQ